VLSGSGTSFAGELCTLLAGDWMEALLQAHDQAASLLDPVSFSRTSIKKQSVKVFLIPMCQLSVVVCGTGSLNVILKSIFRIRPFLTI
jgi:hypothetical protein